MLKNLTWVYILVEVEETSACRRFNTLAVGIISMYNSFPNYGIWCYSGIYCII